MALSKEDGGGWTPPKAPVVNPFNPPKKLVLIPPKKISAIVSGSGKNDPSEGSGKNSSGNIGTSGTGTTQGGGSMWKGKETFRLMVGPGNGSSGFDEIASAKKRTVGKVSFGKKHYNVGTNTSPSGVDPSVGTILFGGTGGGGNQIVPTEKVSFLSSIPTIVWIILAVGGGYFLLKKM
jgi:hypothetical protein